MFRQAYRDTIAAPRVWWLTIGAYDQLNSFNSNAIGRSNALSSRFRDRVIWVD